MQTSCCVSAMIIGSLVLGFFCSPGYSSNSLTSANTAFGFSLFGELVDQDNGGNIFISPASVAMALAITYNGARGETQEKMAEALKLNGISLQQLNKANAELMSKLKNLDDGVLFNVANSLWAQKGEKFKPDFMERNQRFYKAHIEALDFGDPDAPAIIDAWVKEKTGGKIEKIVDEIPGGVILYLINAVYFKGLWAVKFDEKYTGERDFILLDGSKKKVPMMATQSDRFGYYHGDRFEAISLPYGNGNVSMYIFLPDMESSLKEFYSNLNAGNWESWMSRFQKEDVTVVLPRFKLEYEIVLNDALAKLGMGVAFDGSKADFTNMRSGKCWIDEVKHKTFVEVNEEGTEAAAATSVRMKKGGANMIRIDRPFFCAIVDNSIGTVLFMGSIVEP